MTGYLILAGQFVQHVFVGECVERALLHHFFEDSVDNAGQLDLVGQVGVDSGVSKVWSLTQFYPVDFSQSECEKVHSHHTQNQGLRQLFLTVA